MKVCILGNGLTSLSLAKALINLGLKVDIFSTNLKNIYDKSQTLGISRGNVEYFNKRIININKLIWNIKKIEIKSENLNNKKILDFENNKKYLFSIVKNYELYNYLLLSLKKKTLLSFKKSNGKNLNLNKYDLIVNTDSKNYLSKKFFFKRVDKKYNSFGYVTIIYHKKVISNRTAVQIFTKKGPLAFLPISEKETSIVYSKRGGKNLDKKDLLRLIKEKNKMYEIKKIKKLKSFELKSSNLRSYYYKNVLAFGDLLHRLHPLAGQGFNMSVRDIKLLINLINSKINLGLKIDSSTCIEFEKKIKSQNYLFSSGIDFIYEFFKFESQFDNKIISKSIRFFGKNKIINQFFTKFADKGSFL